MKKKIRHMNLLQQKIHIWIPAKKQNFDFSIWTYRMCSRILSQNSRIFESKFYWPKNLFLKKPKFEKILEFFIFLSD